MSRAPHIDEARRFFAGLTATLEDAALVAAEGQGSANIETARRTCERLIEALNSSLSQTQQLRRRLG